MKILNGKPPFLTKRYTDPRSRLSIFLRRQFLVLKTLLFHNVIKGTRTILIKKGLHIFANVQDSFLIVSVQNTSTKLHKD